MCLFALQNHDAHKVTLKVARSFGSLGYDLKAPVPENHNAEGLDVLPRKGRTETNNCLVSSNQRLGVCGLGA